MNHQIALEPPVLLPERYCGGAACGVDLGTATADFWLEDAKGQRRVSLENTQVTGTQILQPVCRLQIVVADLAGEDRINALFNGSAFIRFGGDDPISCIEGEHNDAGLTLRPLKEPLDVCHRAEPGTAIESVLFGFPALYGAHDVMVENSRTDDARREWWRCGQVRLSAGNWRIHISSHANTEEWIRSMQRSGGLTVTHGCRICKTNGETIDWSEAKHITDCLHHFLSFARGHWQPLGNVRLLSDGNECLSESWGVLRGIDRPIQDGLSWWSPHPDGDKLNDVFQPFYSLWQDSAWHDTLRELIYWYLQANLAGRGHVSADAALVLSQATLEKLAWFYVTQVRKAVSEDAFQPGKLRASDQIRLLATLLNLPHAIPNVLSSIQADASGKRFEDAFHALTTIRNQLVHSGMKRNLRPGAEFDAWNLSQWYVEMCMLRLMGYRGRYANRLKLNKWAGETEPVPWADDEETLP